MILSIRHRILIPFLFITGFMTCLGILMAIDMINRYYNHQLFQETAPSRVLIEHHLSNIIRNHQRPSFFLHNNDDHVLELSTSLPDQYHFLVQDSQIYIRSTTDATHTRPLRFSKKWQGEYTNIFIQSNGHTYRLDNPSQLVDGITSTQPLDFTLNNRPYRRFVFQHPSIENVFFYVDVNRAPFEKQRLATTIGAIALIATINAMIILFFYVFLRRITRSLFEITSAAKKISKGHRLSPMKVKSNDEFGLLARSFNDMLNNVQTKTAELIYEKNRSKMILAQLPDGIIVTDLEHKLIMANRAAENMLEFSTDSAKGHALIRYLKNENLYTFFSNEMHQMDINQLVRNITIPDTQGHHQTYQIIISPLLDSTYQKTGLITVIRNITKENQVRVLKDAFLRFVTHELRTPLTSIIGFLNIIKKEMHGPLNAKQKEFLSIALLNSSILKTLINNLLDLSIIHSGQCQIDKDWFNSSDLIHSAFMSINPIINQKKNTLLLDMPDPTVLIYGDKQKIIQMIQGLLLNANKYTENGQIECIVTPINQAITIIIRDNGRGLPPEHVTALQQSLQQKNIDPMSFSDTMSIELAITKELVYLHDGDMHLESDIGVGTSVTITLPIPQNNTEDDILDPQSVETDDIESPILTHQTNS